MANKANTTQVNRDRNNAMSKMVTRCPQCQTSFRVTEEHLKIANGAVRCGSCLNVFKAAEHWVPEAPLATAPVTASTPISRIAAAIPTPSFLKSADAQAASVTVDSAPPATKLQFDQAAIDNVPKGKFQFDQRSIDSSSATGLLGTPDDRQLTTQAVEPKVAEASSTPPNSQKDLSQLSDDDKISDDFLSDGDSDDNSGSAQPDFGTEDDDYSSVFDDVDISNADSDDFDILLSGNLDDLDDLVVTPDSQPAPATVLHGLEEDEEESWATALLDELDDDGDQEQPSINPAGLDYVNPTDTDVALRDLGLDRLSTFITLGETSQAHPLTSPAASEPVASTVSSIELAKHQAALLAHIEPAPIEINREDEEEKKLRLKTRLMEISICAVLALAIGVQFLAFNFSRLAKQESTRPMMATLCNVLQCTLPPSEEWRTIKVSNLVVRQHPTAANGLIVDAILYNHSSRELPFPKLELYFNDLEQLPVASRRFEPAEYLAGELSGKTLMPSARPIHIAFEVVNPGEKAVNWRLDVTPFH
jgi:predicted Zn finger-like uncharacterized protein